MNSVQLRMRPLWQRLLRVPWVFLQHDRMLRSYHPWPLRWWVAVQLTAIILWPAKGDYGNQ